MNLLKIFCLSAIVTLSALPLANAAKLDDVRVWQSPDKTRVVFDVSAVIDYTLFTLSNPHRVVLDIKNARLSSSVDLARHKDGVLNGIRSGVRNGRDLRVVLDLNAAVSSKSFALKPSDHYGHRLVVDLQPVDLKDFDLKSIGPQRVHTDTAIKKKKTVVVKKAAPLSKLRDVVVAIDAGHGGEDPGAHGPNGVNEKDVVYAIAKELAALVRKERGMKPLMIRTGDYYLRLRNRVKKARAHNADIFISIHADAFKNPRVSGASVYVLSPKGASSEMARLLAERENASDRVGGVALDDKDDVLKIVLVDLAQTATIESSYKLGGTVLSALKDFGDVHKRDVEQAAFAVLKSPDIPSILVEAAFISNPREEGRLVNKRHQRAVAQTLMKGVRGYFARHTPPGTWLAQNRHVISEGETLSLIARQYRVSVDRLRVVNNIVGDRVKVGQVLNIPNGRDS
ncbi:MAG: AMIN domain-containing protein [Gammaproteobacteria bacterium]|nr:AMIN domain-containing protein [Gammaproteobacteria bacterium]